MNKRIDFMRSDVLEIRRELDSGKNWFLKEELSIEEFERELIKELDLELKEEWKEYSCDVIEELDDEIEEEKCYKLVVERIKEKANSVKNYIHDLCADIYMALLRADSNCDVDPDDTVKKEWASKAYNTKINKESAKEHYPLVDYRRESVLLCKNIPGGCKEYHNLMMQQENIGIFDIGSEIESLEKYAFSKTHDIFDKLKKSSIENLLLLEKTQGIVYTDQLFGYLKCIKENGQLEEMKEIIECVTEMPMFIRKDITDEIGQYLQQFRYNSASVQCVKKTINGITYIIEKVYKKIWRYSWQMYKEGRFPDYALKSRLTELWRKYSTEIEIKAYEILNKKVKLHGRRDGKEDFYLINRELTRLDENGEMILLEDSRQNSEILDICERKIEEAQWSQKNRDNDIDKILQEACDEYARQENDKWEKISPRRKTVNLGPMDVYARIHESIVRILNE